MRFLLDLVFPPKCVGCEKTGALLCGECEKTIKKPKSVRKLDVTGMNLRVAVEDSDLARKLVYVLKYKFDKSVARIFGRFLREVLGENDKMVLVPVPLHKKRQKMRAWNQSAELARRVGLPVEDLLVRVRETRQQMKLGRAERLENMRNAFFCEKGVDSGKFYVLVDDVATTGATLADCERALREKGAKNVEGVVILRVN